MDDFSIDHEKLWKCLDIVNQRINMEDVLRNWGLQLRKTSGQFAWKTQCPLPNHIGKGSNGRERTPSFCISNDNRFYCFGCNSFGGIVDLVSLVQGVPKIEVIKSLAIELGIIDKTGKWDENILSSIPKKTISVFDPEKTVEPYILRTSAALRDHVVSFEGKRYEEEFNWSERVGKKIDELLENIGYEDWEQVKNIYNSIISSIQKRRNK